MSRPEIAVHKTISGRDIEMISENLGHTSVRTTEIYLGSFELEQREEVTKHLSAFKKKTIQKEEQ